MEKEKQITTGYSAADEQLWDTLTGPGLFDVVGYKATSYLIDRRLDEMLCDRFDRKTLLVIGQKQDQEDFIDRLLCDGIVSDGDQQKKLFAPVPKEDEEFAMDIPYSLQSEEDADFFAELIAKGRDGFHPISAVVLLHQEGHLKHLDKILRVPVWKGGNRILKEVPVYHVQSAAKISDDGIDLREPPAAVAFKKSTGSMGSWRDVFHSRTEALTLPDNVEIVVRGLCNVGNISIWGALPKHGKSYLFLSIIKALLSGMPWLNYFEVSQSKRVIYLVPEVGLRGVVKRLRKLKMLDYLYDPATNPEGRLFVQTLSSLTKLTLDDPRLLEAVKDADVFVDPLIRYIAGDENNAGEQRILSNKLLNLLGCASRSVWVAHHSPKAFKDVRDITTQNVLRGTSEFAAFPDIIFGVLKTNDETARLYIKCTDARDDDEYLGDFEVELRPWVDDTGDLKLVVKPGKGTPLKEQRKAGRKADPDKQAKLDFLMGLPDSMSNEDKAEALNEQFKSDHGRQTVSKWLGEKAKPFDTDKKEQKQ